MPHSTHSAHPEGDHTCPWWFIRAFDNPLRRLIQPPERILAGLVKEGQTVLDVGCGIGYFTIPLARMVGECGRIIAADLQEQMLAGVHRRAKRAGLLPRIRLHRSEPDRIGIAGPIDFALAFWMVHEVREQRAILGEIHDLLKPGGQLLVIEPVVHVSGDEFDKTAQVAAGQGFISSPGPRVRISRSILLGKAG